MYKQCDCLIVRTQRVYPQGASLGNIFQKVSVQKCHCLIWCGENLELPFVLAPKFLLIEKAVSYFELTL